MTENRGLTRRDLDTPQGHVPGTGSHDCREANQSRVRACGTWDAGEPWAHQDARRVQG